MKIKLFKRSVIDRRNRAGYIFILPFIIGLIIIFIPAFFQTVQFSFSEVTIPTVAGESIVAKWEGFARYWEVLGDPDFKLVFLATIKDIVINLPVIVLFSFFIAIILNRDFYGRTIARVLFFLPVILFSGVAAYAGSSGADNALTSISVYAASSDSAGGVFASMGDMFNFYAILSSLDFSPTLISFMVSSVERLSWIIQSSGVQMLVFLAALQSIPASVFEAAQVEGLTGWEMFWKITLPMISPMILVNVVYTIVDSYANPRYILRNTIEKTSFQGMRLDQAAAMSMLYFAVMMILIGVLNGIISRVVFYND